MKNQNEMGNGPDGPGNELGLIALQNVALADKTYTTARNSLASFLKAALLGADELAVSNVAMKPQPGAGYVAVYGAAAVNDTDLLVNLQMELPVGDACQFPNGISVLGWLITERFQNFTGGRAHGMTIRGYSSNYVEAPIFRRDLTIQPLGDANSTTEFIVLNMRPSVTLGYPADSVISGQTVQSLTSVKRDPKGYLQPLLLKPNSTATINTAFSSIVVNLQGLGAGQQVSATITPLFRTVDCIKTLCGILNIPYERL